MIANEGMNMQQKREGSPKRAKRATKRKRSSTPRRASSRRRTAPVPTDPDALLREEQAADLLGFTRRALQSWRQTGEGPRFVRASARGIRYRRKDLAEWAEDRVRRSTSDEGGFRLF